MFLDVVAGFVVGFFLFRAGLPSVFPLLLFLPFLSFFSAPFFLVGVAAVAILSSVFYSTDLAAVDWVIGFLVAGFALFFSSIFLPLVNVDSVVFPILVAALLGWLLRFSSSIFSSIIAAFGMMVIGFWLFHLHAIPSSVSSFLLGWWGFSFFLPVNNHFFTTRQKWADGVIGCLLGFLPGLGPGLANAFWFSGKSSPVLGVSNLIFSLGFFSLTGNVRSIFAAELSRYSPLSLFSILAWLGIILVLGSVIFFEWHLLSFSISPWLAYSVVGVVIFAGAGPLSFLVWLGSFSLRTIFDYVGFSPQVGSFVLLPSILWFYYPFA